MRRRNAVFVLLGIVLAALVFSLYGSVALLTTTTLTVPAPVSEPLRVVQLSDLHNARFGRDNDTLVEAVRSAAPDLILCTGDLFNADEQDTSTVSALLGRLTDIAPVYCSLGNHEEQWGRNFGADPAAVYRDAGAVLLEQEFVDLEVRGCALRIGGLYGYACPPDRGQEWGSQPWYDGECRFLQEFCNTDRTTLLLCHMPVAWLDYGSLDSWDVDVVFAGHAHGGQVRLPLVGGLYAPDQGWFPGREAGLYTSADGLHTLVLSRGLGSSGMRLPRLNNFPELVTVDLVPRA
ncbi:MAG: metallophosphoesterase [Gemmiger sp.]|uniref:metallophosphoesterase n=1 Tax=Gemmiger sp. TaxID=2049027 RepID=UPI002E761F5A|nr:metallophosphoesterase [Gemmiger sp.]MEE0801569.1 metallophosphoesterase [Gemmiger sp.]